MFLLFALIFISPLALAQPDSMIIKNDRLYINKHLPLYLWVSSDPDNRENLVLLDATQNNRYANPFFTDTEGFNTIYPNYGVKRLSRDRLIYTRRHIYRVYSDGMAPVSSYQLYNSRRSYKNGKLYYYPGVKIKISAVDGMSGVKKTYFKINDKPYTEYSEPIELKNDGKYSLMFYSEDYTANKEKPKKIIINLLPEN